MMTVADGFGMLVIGLIAITIGATITYFVINKLERDRREEQETKEREKIYGK
jgi:uncharacterized membrane protein YdjX (TVP38/TMEM64 family)|tara:strand:+ start:52 stop:207 length:156 start_codon:yes stop_codon:yes gene_type:complete